LKLKNVDKRSQTHQESVTCPEAKPILGLPRKHTTTHSHSIPRLEKKLRTEINTSTLTFLLSLLLVPMETSMETSLFVCNSIASSISTRKVYFSVAGSGALFILCLASYELMVTPWVLLLLG
jgi:hypothetical protein